MERLGAPAADEGAAEAAHTRPDGGNAPESVIRITAAGKERHYISYATGLLDRGERLKARRAPRPCAHDRPDCARARAAGSDRRESGGGSAGHSTVVLTAMGSVINKCITVAEILKRRVAGLHQWNQIKSIVLEVLPPPPAGGGSPPRPPRGGGRPAAPPPCFPSRPYP